MGFIIGLVALYVIGLLKLEKHYKNKRTKEIRGGQLKNATRTN